MVSENIDGSADEGGNTDLVSVCKIHSIIYYYCSTVRTTLNIAMTIIIVIYCTLIICHLNFHSKLQFIHSLNTR